MDNKKAFSISGCVDFTELFVNMNFWFLDPISVWSRGQKTRGEKGRQIAFSPIKSDEELPYTI